MPSSAPACLIIICITFAVQTNDLLYYTDNFLLSLYIEILPPTALTFKTEILTEKGKITSLYLKLTMFDILLNFLFCLLWLFEFERFKGVELSKKIALECTNTDISDL